MKDANLKRPISWLGIAAAAATIFVAGCHSAPPSKPLSQLTPIEMQGYGVFQSHCAACHYANRDGSLHGPGLQGVFKKPYLPSGAPANDDRVRAAIQQGRNMMPAFGNVLDDRQMRDLIAYLHTL
jgi:mono/diheme cytochrome c family protein